ncbi:MAG: Holliday junction resolvase RuvX [Chloroflexi bacterium]|nr:Holliday junction resolvase RuvX [Chloroflexota bacterium]
MRILGLDIGDRRIGVAMSDPGGSLASPLGVITRKDDDSSIEAIASLVSEHGVELVVLGMPHSLHGKEGPQAEKVKAYSLVLSQKLKTPVRVWDERFSTVEAERLLRESGIKAWERKSRRDAWAAALILQGYLDSLRQNTGV